MSDLAFPYQLERRDGRWYTREQALDWGRFLALYRKQDVRVWRHGRAEPVMLIHPDSTITELP